MIEILRERECKFPTISVSDSVIDNIQIVNSTITFRFNNNGFCVRNAKDKSYRRVSNAQFVLFNCAVENIDIFILEETHIFIRKKYVKKHLDFNSFTQNVNNKNWRFEVIQEYKSDVGGLFIGHILGMRKTHNLCYLRIDYGRFGYKYNDDTIN